MAWEDEARRISFPTHMGAGSGPDKLLSVTILRVHSKFFLIWVFYFLQQFCAFPSPGVNLKKAWIMVVDDDDAVRLLIENVLIAEGYEVLTANSAEEAIQTLTHLDGRVDLMITDVNLPGMRGPALRDEVESRYPWARVLFISGEEGLQIEPLLRKPFSLNELVRLVKQILSNSAPTRN